MQFALIGKVALALALALGAAAARAEEAFPTRPIRIVVPFAPGGTNDNVSRIVGQKLTEILGQPVVIDNRPGAGGAIAAEMVAKSAPDGYTLLSTTTGILAINPHLLKVPYDPLKDFTPVAMVATSFGALAVNKDLPVTNLQELIAYAKANPGKLNYGSAGNGTITHLYGEIFKQAAGIDIVHVPYRGSALAMNDLIAGQIQMQFDTVILPQIQAGALRGIAMIRDRWEGLPDLPTLKEQGFEAETGLSWFGYIAPAGLPGPVAEKLAGALAAALKNEELLARFKALGVAPHFLAGADYVRQIESDHKVFGEAIRRGNIRLEQ